MRYEISTSSHIEALEKVKVFFKVGQTSRSQPLSHKIWYIFKSLFTRNGYVKYEKNSNLVGIKIMTRQRAFSTVT